MRDHRQQVTPPYHFEEGLHALERARASRAAIRPISYVLVLRAMKAAPLSHVVPSREVSMLFAALIGSQSLGERDRLARIAGAVLIAFGIMAFALG